MSDLTLLVVVVPGKIRITLRGPGAHPHVGVAGLADADPGHLVVAASGGVGPVVTWQGPDGTWHDWVSGSGGPRLYEETRYRLVVEDLTGVGVPEVAHRDPRLIGDVDRHVSQHLLTASLDFRRQVGFSRLVFAAGGATVEVEVEVFPTKLDYKTDYRQLVHEVSAGARGLALEYLRATFARGGVEATDDPTTLEWLLLVRNEIDAIERALQYVAAHPHRVLERTAETTSSHRLRRPDPAVRRAVARGLGRGAPLTVVGVGKVRSELPAQRAHETLNTPEHRWLRHQLAVIAADLEAIHAGIALDRDHARRAGRGAARLEAEGDEVALFVRRVHHLMGVPALAGALGPPPVGPPSLTLLNGLGYREAYRSIMILRLGLAFDGEATSFSLKDLPELYETWCFLRLAQLIGELSQGTVRSGDLVEAAGGGVRIKLRAGQRSEVLLDAGARKLRLLYNPTYPGLTGAQRPDIVLEFHEDGWPQIVVVFDAKYRLRSEAEYIETFGSPGPPIDAVNALHRYRDAIVVEAERGRGRPTVRGVALFPLPAAACEGFTTSRLYRALSSLGVGALPFSPANVELVAGWLREILPLTAAELATPGPPFLAWEHLRTAPSP